VGRSHHDDRGVCHHLGKGDVRRRLPIVSFAVGAHAYDRFMGRYSAPLAPVFATFASVVEGLRVLDVGCGPGALIDELVQRVGPGAVAAVDPSETFVTAAQERHPSIDVQRATAEELPFEDGTFDATLAQLVVHFMKDPVVGLREMARVTHREGVVAACVWDHDGGGGPLSLFWNAVGELDPDVEGEAHLAGARDGHLAQLFREAGLTSIDDTSLSIAVTHPSFDDWWEPFTYGVGPAGRYVAGLDATGKSSCAIGVATRCRRPRSR
jgi:SAM-dependent methyltransferase